MTFREAKKLHNGDEVVDKATGDHIRVLSIIHEPRFGPVPKMILIEGNGKKLGYGEWQHTMVK